ncbi:DUF1760-domain-containing protein [Venustampulla echinocandica]|uniref:DUF1760-domain-containing protein n=1 Tax=Venustampulla echinocandica TaxID=2656787 RepID=A0A370TCT4_9HELO|nr:DUF1760-domain-containing protein [Venustampulla echinocandica]RDL32031.1 DUF1760-domain-containing protein [Venustampulla echinocandica]
MSSTSAPVPEPTDAAASPAPAPAAPSSDAIIAITKSLPPATDYLTYLTILESHLSPDILPSLNDILQDAGLTQNIGWDLIHLLLPLPGAEKCLATIARLGNPREVVLKVTEALQLLDLDASESDSGSVDANNEEAKEKSVGTEPTSIDKFCELLNLLSILHPRIKTKYPSRFLSTSLMAALAAFRPSHQATLAVISFVHTISGKKRPSLPGRKSSINIPVIQNGSSESDPSAPDPEAQDEDPREAGIQTKLLQSFVTHILEDYVKANPLEWSARLLELFAPEKVVAGRRSLGEAFRDDPTLQSRDIIVGQLVALSRDLDLTNYSDLFDAIYKADTSPAEDESEENYPSTPGDIPLSQLGSLFLIVCFTFASILFESKAPQPKLSIFPDHAKLVKSFIGIEGPTNIGNEDQSIIDAILAIGLWLEHNNEFVSGPLEDDDFLRHLQSLSLLSANTPSPTLRYAAHVLTSDILHSHPVDRVRLTFISDTLEHCPYETLKGSAVSWLKDEIITGFERKSENVFTSTVALAAVQLYLFPDTSALSTATDQELTEELMQAFPFYMAVVNFIIFITGEQYVPIVPSSMMIIVEEIFLRHLRTAQVKALASLPTGESGAADDSQEPPIELQMLGERITLCSAKIDG